jgi:hypothetical protein
VVAAATALVLLGGGVGTALADGSPGPAPHQDGGAATADGGPPPSSPNTPGTITA